MRTKTQGHICMCDTTDPKFAVDPKTNYAPLLSLLYKYSLSDLHMPCNIRITNTNHTSIICITPFFLLGATPQKWTARKNCAHTSSTLL